jgi:radical SAM protein with 4Fe4S-binding SPASM domain
MASYKELNHFNRLAFATKEWFRRGLDPRFLWYRLKWNIVAKYDVVPSFPLHLDIETTEACNLRCVMCVHGTTGVPDSGMIDMSFAKRIIDDAAKGGCKSVKFNWRGEPTLHKGLEELVAYAKEAGILEVQMNTNGIPLTEKRIEALIDAGMDRFIFSMDGATKETYETIRVGASYDRLLQNIRLVHEIRTRKGRTKPFIRIQMVRMKSNQDEVDAFLDMWKKIADDIAVKDVTNRGQGNQLSVGEQITVGRRRCNQPWQRMIVARDGKVFPCCSDWGRTYEIGDANTSSLKSIWKGKPMEALRQINREKRLDEVDPCKNCFVTSSYEWRRLTPEELAERDIAEAQAEAAPQSPIATQPAAPQPTVELKGEMAEIARRQD